jgi:hypothetical protein
VKTYSRMCLTLLLLLGLAQREAPAQNALPTDGTLTGLANSELPHWFQLGGEDRVRMETLDGIGFLATDNTYLLERLRLNLNILPLSWLKFVFQAQDSRVFFTDVHPAPTSQRDPMDLRIGYVQFGNSETGMVSLRAGRQPLDFGEGRLVADPQWSNVGRSFDAARLTLRYRKLKVDAFSGASDKIYADGFSTPTPGEHFDGVYGSLDKVIPNSTIEPYVFWKMEHNVKGELVKSGDLSEKTAGIRWVGKLPVGFDYGMESALQRGTQATEPISAWATHVVLGNTLPNARHLPRFFLEFNRGSGDQNPRNGVHSDFDTLFPSSHDKFGLTDLFSWTNMVHARAGFQYKVRQNLTLAVADNDFWLADRRDGIYSGGKQIVASNGHEGSHIGQEPDLQGRWTLARHTIGDLTFGHVIPGAFLQNAKHGSAFNIVALAVTQQF